MIERIWIVIIKYYTFHYIIFIKINHMKRLVELLVLMFLNEILLHIEHLKRLLITIN